MIAFDKGVNITGCLGSEKTNVTFIMLPGVMIG
jgi:hypothetical protein